MNDLIRLVCEMAAKRFGSKDTFNAANFAQAFRSFAGVDNLLDGKEVRAILCGRPDVAVLSGNSHFQLRTS